jgi:hypothetical protein
VQFVDGDTFTIGDRENTIVAERFVQKDYPHTPTADYLYFQLPRYHALHVACMYSKWTGPPVRGRELITDRERDVMGLIGAKGLAPVSLIRLDREKDGAELLPFADLERLMRDGISSAELSAPFAARSVEDLRANRAKLVDDALRDGLPASIFNGLTYEALGRKDLARALEYATLQALIGPSDANGWDTLGEVEYVMGQPAAARADDRAAKKLGLTTAGEPVWEKDLDDLRRQWAAAAPPGHP